MGYLVFLIFCAIVVDIFDDIKGDEEAKRRDMQVWGKGILRYISMFLR